MPSTTAGLPSFSERSARLRLQQVGAAQLGHGPELVAAFLALGPAVELGDQVGPAQDVEDRPFAADGERLGRKSDVVAQMVTQLRRECLTGHQEAFRVASRSVLSSSVRSLTRFELEAPLVRHFSRATWEIYRRIAAFLSCDTLP